MGDNNKAELNRLLNLKSTTSSSVYRSLFVHIVTIFEVFIRELVESVVSEQCASCEKYEDLPERLKLANIYHNGAIFVKSLSDDSQNSVDYSDVIVGIGTCVAGEANFRLNIDAFTSNIGNCTPSRVDRHFRDIGLSEAFSLKLGDQKPLRKWAQDAGSKETRNRARETLAAYIVDRNEIVHGNGAARTVVLTDVEEIATFFLALMASLAGLAQEQLA
jgi:hypothetical protein